MRFTDKLPKPYLFEIDTPLVLHKGRVFTPKSGDQATDTITLGSKQYSLEEIATPAEFEALYFAHYTDQIEKLEENYVNTHLKAEYTSKVELEKQLKENKELSLIVTKILPSITAAELENQIDSVLTGEDIEEVAGIDSLVDDVPAKKVTSAKAKQASDRFRKDMKAKIEQEYKDLVAQKTSAEPQPDAIELLIDRELNINKAQPKQVNNDGSLFNSTVLPNASVMIIEDSLYELMTIPKFIEIFKDKVHPEFYARAQKLQATDDDQTAINLIDQYKEFIPHSTLSRMKNKINSSKIVIDGNYYLPLFSEKTNTVIARYKRALEKQVKLRAIDGNAIKGEQLAQIEQEKQKLSAIANKRNYEKNGAGFEKVENRYYVYVKTPEYALKSPHTGDYYVFPPAKIGVPVYLDRNVCKVGEPIVMNEYEHPFLNGTRAMQRICLGEFRVPPGSTTNPEDAAKLWLDQGKKTLMMGYLHGSNPYRNIDSFDRLRKSKRTIQRKGLVVLNEQMVDERRG